MALPDLIEIRVKRLLVATICIPLMLALAACGGEDDPPPLPQQAQSFAVAKAECGDGDKQETGLQGQVPMSAQVGGFKGFNCNLQQVSATPSVRGQGVFGMFALMHDKSGHTCGYTGGAFEDSLGTSVVDLTDPKNAVETAVLTTPGLINPGEGLKTHEGRGYRLPASPVAGINDGYFIPHGRTDGFAWSQFPIYRAHLRA